VRLGVSPPGKAWEETGPPPRLPQDGRVHAIYKSRTSHSGYEMNLVRSHKILTATVALLACFILWSELWSVTASTRGGLAARYDISRGHYEIQGYGLPVPWRPEFGRLLQERYGVRFRTVALCTVSPSLVAYVDSYDSVSAAAVNRKFAHDAVRECSEEARKSWEQTRKIGDAQVH
jgi:hypothetical protein